MRCGIPPKLHDLPDGDGPCRSFVQSAAKDCFEPIVLKNPKNPHPHFSAKIRCIRRARPIFAQGDFGAAHIAKPLIWPTPWPNFPTGTLRQSFSPFLGENRVFQHNQPNLRIGFSCCVRMQHGNCCNGVNFDAAIERQNRSFMQVSAWLGGRDFIEQGKATRRGKHAKRAL